MRNLWGTVFCPLKRTRAHIVRVLPKAHRPIELGCATAGLARTWVPVYDPRMVTGRMYPDHMDEAGCMKKLRVIHVGTGPTGVEGLRTILNSRRLELVGQFAI